MTRAAVLFLTILSAGAPARAWTDIGHVIITRAANQRLLRAADTPEPLKRFIRDNGYVRPGEGGLRTLILAGQRRYLAHRALAHWTLPVWLYVSVTGVVVYWMLYRMPGG